ncbi:G1 S-specific cyclin-D1 [Pelobates cultripes]|uniref:G1 S-specific cyclin-D1 n=1 Tax=Pelobates cultripes TaxID=61616 RepID=A0AAD1WRA6_PELCU|nr:G1 S-specific cyclin-D1 [Pelobates cultripes]
MEGSLLTEIKGESCTLTSGDDLELFLQGAGLTNMPQQGTSPPTKNPGDSESINKRRHSVPSSNTIKRLTPLPKAARSRSDKIEKVYMERIEKVYVERIEKVYMERIEKVHVERIEKVYVERIEKVHVERIEKVYVERIEKVYKERIEKGQNQIPAEELHILETVMENSLMCWETETELRAQPDPVLLQDQVLINLLQAEHRYIPSATYFQCVQKEIRPYMRRMLTSWMLEVCEDQRCGEQVFTLAVNCLDRVLSLVSVEKRQLQLVGAVCLLVASKLRGSKPMTTETMCMYADYCFTDKELRMMELLVLNKLKWDMEAVIPHDFLAHFLDILKIPRDKVHQVRKHTETFIALCTTDYNFIALPPSLVAAASVAASVTGLRPENLGMRFSNISTTSYLAHAIHCDPNVLRMCQEQIEVSLKSSLREAETSRLADSKSVEEIERSSTPTDVLDFDL